jgi:carboxyl-terminal processing protease
MKKKRLCILTCLTIYSVIACFAQESSIKKDLSNEEKIYGLSLLWKEASDNFAYFDNIPDLDWDKTYKEYLLKVSSTKSTIEYYNVLKQFYALLKHHHSFVYPPQEYQDYFDEPKIKIANIQRHAIVENVGESLKESIPIGSEIIKVSGVQTNVYLKDSIFPMISASREDFVWESGLMELLKGKEGTRLQVSYITPKKEIKEINLMCNSKVTNENWVRINNNTEVFDFKWLENDLAYIAINTLDDDNVVTDFENKLPELLRCKGLIIDLRRNGGGNADIGNSIIKYLINKPIPTFKLETRETKSIYRAWGKWGNEKYLKYILGNAWYEFYPDTVYPASVNRLNVPIAILTGNTGSAAEDFLFTIANVKNVTFIGKTTAGCTGTPFIFDLPGGGIGAITTTKEISMDGYDTRNGFKPEIEIQRTVQDLIDENDPVLKKGIEVLNNVNKER